MTAKIACADPITSDAAKFANPYLPEPTPNVGDPPTCESVPQGDGKRFRIRNLPPFSDTTAMAIAVKACALDATVSQNGNDLDYDTSDASSIDCVLKAMAEITGWTIPCDASS
jgi:hypothetical protein